MNSLITEKKLCIYWHYSRRHILCFPPSARISLTVILRCSFLIQFILSYQKKEVKWYLFRSHEKVDRECEKRRNFSSLEGKFNFSLFVYKFSCFNLKIQRIFPLNPLLTFTHFSHSPTKNSNPFSPPKPKPSPTFSLPFLADMCKSTIKSKNESKSLIFKRRWLQAVR